MTIMVATGLACADQPAARWAASPHGPMLERILPPTFAADQLPEPDSAGARLTLRYCVQCHHLANPAMHHAAKWPAIVDRMVIRMQGRGNMGKLMAEMMAGVAAPAPGGPACWWTTCAAMPRPRSTPGATRNWSAPLASHSGSPASNAMCSPDPRRHGAAEWPRVVARMEQNMRWMNRVVGSRPVPGEPQLRVEDINAFLVRHARRP